MCVSHRCALPSADASFFSHFALAGVDTPSPQVAKNAAEALKRSRLRIGLHDISTPTWTGRSGAAGMPGLRRRPSSKRFGKKVNPRLASATEAPAHGNDLLSASPLGRPPVAAAAAATTTTEAAASLGGGSPSPQRRSRISGKRRSGFEQAPGMSGAKAVGSSDLLRGLRDKSAKDGVRAVDDADALLLDPSRRESEIVALRDFVLSQGGTTTTQQIVRHFGLRLSSEQVIFFRSMLREIADFSKGTREWRLKHEFV